MEKALGETAYPAKQHLVYILPLLATILLMAVFIGNEDRVKAFFLEVDDAYPRVDNWLRLAGDLFEYGFYCIYAVLFVVGLRKGNRELVRFAISFSILLIATLGFVEIVKIAVGRPRPLVDGEFIPFSFASSHQSFPSGQTTTALIGAAPLALRHGRAWLSFLLGFSPAVMAFSRIYDCKHHPSDALGSLFFGSLAMLFFWWLLRQPFTGRLADAVMKKGRRAASL